MKIVDLRSDTVTLPTSRMLEAIASAKLGDDQYGEDETVNRLQKMAAKRMGKEDALLVISGTQANLISIMSHTQPGDAIIMEADAHIFFYESAGMAAVAGVMAKALKGTLGALNPSEVLQAIRVDHKPHEPPTTLICLENTHNRAGGTCISEEQTDEICEIAHNQGLSVHIDGARIFNAAIALNTDVQRLVQNADSVSFCLSKGLSCPLGTLLAGNHEFIKRARKNRQMVGGAMRQAGIIAAPGIVALETMISRLREDHENARRLAEGLVKLGVPVPLERVQTNIVLFDVQPLGMDSNEFTSGLEKRGVKASNYGKTLVRMVTHHGIEQSDIDHALIAVSQFLKK